MFLLQLLVENITHCTDIIKIILTYTSVSPATLWSDISSAPWIRISSAKTEEFPIKPKQWQTIPQSITTLNKSNNNDNHKTSFSLSAGDQDNIKSSKKKNDKKDSNNKDNKNNNKQIIKKRKLTLDNLVNEYTNKRSYGASSEKIILPIASIDKDGEICNWFLDDVAYPFALYNINTITCEHLDLVRRQFCGEDFGEDDPSPETEDVWDVEPINYNLRFCYSLPELNSNTVTCPPSYNSMSSSSTSTSISPKVSSAINPMSPKLSNTISSMSPKLSDTINPTSPKVSSANNTSNKDNNNKEKNNDSKDKVIDDKKDVDGKDSNIGENKIINDKIIIDQYVPIGVFNSIAIYGFNGNNQCIIFFDQKNYLDYNKDCLKHRKMQRFISHYPKIKQKE